jgi:hypothetical protein
VKVFYTISFFLCLLTETGLAQKPVSNEDSSFILVRTYQGDIADAAVDNLDNLYIVSSKGQIKKFNAAGDSVGVYNQLKNFGRLFSMDVSNPLKILLFYKDFSTVVVLDRFLANLHTVDLRKFSILQAGAIGMSYDDHIWVFDEYDNKLKKIDYQGNRLLETTDLRTVFNQSVAPQKIINDNALVYLADTTNGVFVFDNYGSFKKKIPLVNWQSIAINRNNLVSTNKEIITIYNPSTLLQTQRKNPFFKPYYHSLASADKFVSFSNNRLDIYQYRY